MDALTALGLLSAIALLAFVAGAVIVYLVDDLFRWNLFQDHYVGEEKDGE